VIKSSLAGVSLQPSSHGFLWRGCTNSCLIHDKIQWIQIIVGSLLAVIDRGNKWGCHFRLPYMARLWLSDKWIINISCSTPRNCEDLE
jgi:hypothetical protein